MRDTAARPDFALIGEKDLRRQIDRSVSRALVDGDYAQKLLSDPTVVLEDRGSTPQHYKELHGIHASNLRDFAEQAQSIFWAAESLPRRVPQADRRRLTAAALLTAQPR
jgi:hypothetical protein